MQPNPALQRLGFAHDDRVLILHADDIGMCQATLPAFENLCADGLISSAAAMVPCPWFPQLAAYCRAHPQVDVGVHLTLNSEWDNFRWGPISTRDPASGLIDQEGYFHHLGANVQLHASRPALQAELRAQLDRALAAGIDVTHVDSHMFTLLQPELLSSYIQLASQARLPLLCPRADVAGWQAMGLQDDAALAAAQTTQQLEEQGVVLFDRIEVLSLTQSTERIDAVKQMLDTLPAGLSEIIFHPCIDTPELRAMAPDYLCRIADYDAFMSAELRDYMRTTGIQLIGYRALRDVSKTTQITP
jgi:predicted glycoside hydrolase/deacetylase ChbG (UPF0249 family)